MVAAQVAIPTAELREFCQKWQVEKVSFFGSVLTDAFRPDSDLDVLIDFAPDARPTLFDLIGMRDELQALFGRSVDLIDRGTIEESPNPFRRTEILGSARVVYEG